MSRLYSTGLSGPMDATILAESGWTGIDEMSWFQGLSPGKTWSAARIASASGVSNITGFVIFGIGGRLAARARARKKARQSLMVSLRAAARAGGRCARSRGRG